MKPVMYVALFLIATTRGVFAQEQSLVFPVVLGGTNAESGIVVDTVMVDFASSTLRDRFMKKLPDKKNVIWGGAPTRDPLANLFRDFDFTPFLEMDTDNLKRYVAVRDRDVYAATVLAVRLYQANELGGSLALFERVRQIDPFYVRSAELYSAIIIKTDDLSRAIKLNRKLLDSLPDNPTIRFNLACSYALNNQPEKAMYHLIVLARYDWPDLAHYMIDPDLNSLHQDERFVEMDNELRKSLRERIVDNMRASDFSVKL
jgi:tetratricopeptide (TPR) repeat protein